MFEKTRSFLVDHGLPPGDDYRLPDSPHCFPDGGHYKIEAATVNTLPAAEALLAALRADGVGLDQITHTSGIMRLLDRQIREWVKLTAEAGVQLVMAVGPRGTYDTGAQKFAGSIAAHAAGYRLRGMEQVLRAVEDVRRAVGLGVRGILVFDEGLLWLLSAMRRSGELPPDLRLKASAALGVSNPIHCRVIAELGADSINLQRDLELPMIAAVRAATAVPLDIHSDNPPASGGFIRTYEVPEIVRVAAPVYIKSGNSAVDEHDVAMSPEQARRMAEQIACVVETIRRHRPQAVQSRHRG